MCKKSLCITYYKHRKLLTRKSQLFRSNESRLLRHLAGVAIRVYTFPEISGGPTHLLKSNRLWGERERRGGE